MDLIKKIELNDNCLAEVNGGVITPEMTEVYAKLCEEVQNIFDLWLEKNENASNVEKSNYYNECFERIYNSLSIDDRMLVNEYLKEMNKI